MHLLKSGRDEKAVTCVRPRDNEYRLSKIVAFALPGTDGVTLGSKTVTAITTDEIEAFREWRKTQGLSPVTVNHDLKLLRKMWNWGIRNGPLRSETRQRSHWTRNSRAIGAFASDDDEQKLLDAANPHLRAIVTALLDTACRPGEILSLQWCDVNLEKREITIKPQKSKTRTGRLIPISTRLGSILEMRKFDPNGKPFPSEAYGFGNPTGEQVKSVRTAWENATDRAGLKNLQLRDLRHEAGVPISYTSKILGHTNLNTTSRCLNIHRRGLHDAMQKLESHRSAVAHPLHTPPQDTPADVQRTEEAPAGNPRYDSIS
jgi:integrase